MDFILYNAVFQVTKAASAIREHLENAVRSGEEELEFLGVSRNAAANTVANLQLDVRIRAPNGVAHGVHLS
jgi:hypothetical protein